MSDTATILFAAEILISCMAVVAVLFWLLRRRNSELQQLQYALAKQASALKEQASGLADAFLQRELTATQELAKTTRGDELIETLTRLRGFWLSAEQQGLKANGTSLSDHHQIAQILKASRLYAQLKVQPAKPAGKPPTPFRSSATSLDDARSLINQQKAAIQDIRDTHAALPADAHSATHEATSSGEHLLQTIDDLECELRRTRQLYQQACSELAAAVQSGEEESDTAVQNLLTIFSSSPASTALHKSQLFLDEMNQAYQQGIGELQRLRDTNARQRELILELEHRLLSAPNGQQPDEGTRQLIEKLRLQLRDYDTCTVILEMEGESLRERISTLTQIITVEGGGSPVSRNDISPELAQQHLKTRRDLDKKALQMIRQIGAATDLPQAATALVAFLQTQRLHTVLFVRGHKEQLWVASDGMIDPRVKTLLQSMEASSSAPSTNDGNSLMLLLPVCRLHIMGDLLTGDDGELVKGFLSRTFVIVDLMFSQLDRQSSSHALIDVEQAAHLRQLLTGIETQHRYLEAETRRIATDHRQEIEHTLTSLPVTPEQKIVIEGLLGDFTAEIDLIARAAVGIHKSLQLAAQSLEELQR